MPNIIGLKEFRENTAEYEKRVSKGESFIVVKRSKPIFKLTPPHEDRWEEIIDFTQIRKGGVEIDEILTRL